MINVTKSYLPPIEDYFSALHGIWETAHLTNHGPLVNQLEDELKEWLGCKHLFFVSNGTIALQIAIKALGIADEVITTPFSYVATTSAIIWENATPVFADICESSLNINPDQVEKAITERTTAILATHVYGYPCQVERLQAIADKHKLKLVYDAAHAFGVKLNDRSILTYGDVSTLSFHATKLFHTIEGGAICCHDDRIAHKISYLRNFGHKGQEQYWGLGINGKNSEFHAAMGLCILPRINDIIKRRDYLSKCYDKNLSGIKLIRRPQYLDETIYNYAYYPILFENESILLTVRDALNASFIFPRRYFYPSLNKLPYLSQQFSMPVSEYVASRVLCLPLYHDLKEIEVNRICNIIQSILSFN